MKPRNQLEREFIKVVENHLTPLNVYQRNNIKDKMMGEPQYKSWIFQTKQTYKGWKIRKTYEVKRYGKADNYVRYNLAVVFGEKDGKTVCASRSLVLMCSSTTFSIWQPITIKDASWYQTQYDKGAFEVSNKRTRRDNDQYEVISYGVDSNVFFEHRDSNVETLVSLGYERFIVQLEGEGKPITNDLYNALRIAHKHHYDLTNISAHQYIAYIRMLKRNHKDIRNPHYICPKDFRSAYMDITDQDDKLKLERERAKREREQIKREQEELERLRKEQYYAENYIKTHSKYFGLDELLSTNKLYFHVLRDVDEFFEEGKAMCHCVFANGYYKKNNCLIISCRDRNGERIETIEVDLKNGLIVQSRAKHNGMSKYHDEIVRHINQSMTTISACRRRRKVAA